MERLARLNANVNANVQQMFDMQEQKGIVIEKVNGNDNYNFMSSYDVATDTMYFARYGTCTCGNVADAVVGSTEVFCSEQCKNN